MIKKLRLNKEFIFVIFISLIFFLLRLTNLTILPIFADEAIYIRWAQIIADDPTNRFIPLSDGKQPLFMWISSFFVKFLASDPLFAARLVSVIFGFGGLVGIYFAAKELFGNKNTAILAALLYTITPFLVFYDRLAVVDGALTAIGVGIFYLGLLLVKRLRLDISLLLGMVLGVALLIKSPAIFYLILIPISLLITDWKSKWKSKVLKFLGYYSISLFIAFVIYNVQRLSPLFYLISQRRPDFVFSFNEVFFDTWWTPFFPRILTEIPVWFGQYVTWPFFALGLIFIFYYLFKRNLSIIVLAIWFIFPIIVEAFFAKGFTARYFVFVTPFFLLILAYGVNKIFESRLLGQKIYQYGLLLILLLPALIFDFWLIVNPQKADIPQKERSGYLEEWSSGYGIFEVANFLKQQPPKEKPILVGTEGRFGTLPDGLQVYLRKFEDITIVGMGQHAEIYTVPSDLKNAVKEGKLSYLVVNESRLLADAKADSSLKLIASYPKAKSLNGNQDQLLLFEVTN